MQSLCISKKPITFTALTFYIFSFILGWIAYDSFHGLPTSLEGVIQQKEITENENPAISREYLVKCLSAMYEIKQIRARNHWKNHKLKETQNNNISTMPSDALHFVFIGDSRIRQIFLLFVEQLPQLDLKFLPFYGLPYRKSAVHDNIVIYSEMLNLVVEFHWSPVLVNKLGHDIEGLFTHLLERTNSYPEKAYVLVNSTTINLRPDIILAGNAAHHMLPEHPHEEEYFKKLETLRPLLKKLSKQAKMLWFDQYPILEVYGTINAHNTHVHSYKMWKYNSKALEILSGIEVFGKDAPWVVEYLRSCLISKRVIGWPNGYRTCNDYIHPGTNAIHEMVQVFMQKFCSTNDFFS